MPQPITFRSLSFGRSVGVFCQFEEPLFQLLKTGRAKRRREHPYDAVILPVVILVQDIEGTIGEDFWGYLRCLSDLAEVRHGENVQRLVRSHWWIPPSISSAGTSPSPRSSRDECHSERLSDT
jgi:hypothetical protein